MDDSRQINRNVNLVNVTFYHYISRYWIPEVSHHFLLLVNYLQTFCIFGVDRIKLIFQSELSTPITCFRYF